MFSKENAKLYIFLAFISILIYKLIDSPAQILSHISGLVSFFSPFLIGILFALLLNPMIMFFENQLKTPRLLNIFVAYIIVSFVVSVGFKLLIPTFIDALTTLSKEVPNYISLLNNFLNKYVSQAQAIETLLPHLQDNLNSILNRLVDLLSTVSSNILVYVFSLTSFIFNIVMGIILSIYMLYEKENIFLELKKIVYASIPIKKADNVVIFFNKCHSIFYHYIIGKLIDSLIIGVLAFIGFKFLLKVDNPLFLSFIIFLTNIIPYFGPFIGAVPPILMTLIYSPIKALWVGVFLLFLQQLDGNLIGPKIMGDQVGLSPLWIISAVLIGGSLFGFLGVFLSVPIAAIIKVSIDKYVQRRLPKKN